ncbi:MAG: Lrp/AsnC family transcriptional regulator [Eubacterium sp.]|nr:Lrp/AsnC family transcriptional regulator [Eubacterium sp.]
MNEYNAGDEVKIDKTDLKILHLLETDARMPVREIARQTYLSSPAVANRIQRMKDCGLIRSFVPDIDFSKIGYHIRAFINLEVQPKDKPEFYPFIQSIPNVVECNCVTGDYSMLIQVLYRRPEELDHLINELQKFGRTKTLIAFSSSVTHRNLAVGSAPAGKDENSTADKEGEKTTAKNITPKKIKVKKINPNEKEA